MYAFLCTYLTYLVRKLGSIFHGRRQNFSKMPNYTLAVHENNHTDRDCMSSKDKETAERGAIVNMAYGIIAVLAFTSNLVFCLAMKRNRKALKTSHDLLIYSWAITDTLTGKTRRIYRCVEFSKQIVQKYEQSFDGHRTRLILRPSSNMLRVFVLKTLGLLIVISCFGNQNCKSLLQFWFWETW